MVLRDFDASLDDDELSVLENSLSDADDEGLTDPVGDVDEGKKAGGDSRPRKGEIVTTRAAGLEAEAMNESNFIRRICFSPSGSLLSLIDVRESLERDGEATDEDKGGEALSCCCASAGGGVGLLVRPTSADGVDDREVG